MSASVTDSVSEGRVVARSLFWAYPKHQVETLQKQVVCGCAGPWPSAWVSQPWCDRGSLHHPAEEPWGLPFAQSLKTKDWWRLVPSVGTRFLWELWALHVFEAVTSSCILRQMLLLPNPMLRGLMPKAAWFFPLPCAFPKKETACDAFQRWYNITSGRLCPQSC